MAFSVFAAARAGAQAIATLFPEGVPGFDVSPGVTVRSRLRPGLEPPGLRIGSLIVRPAVETSVGYDGNPSGTVPAEGSWLVRTQPSVLFGTDWSRHALGGFVSLTDTRYLDTPAQSRTDGSALLGGAVDLGRDRWSLAVAHLAQHQDASQVGALPTDRPVSFTIDTARTSYAASFGRWTLTPAAEIARWRFDAASVAGATVSQAYRDRLVSQGGVTLRYALAPRRELVAVGRVVGQGYPDTPIGQPSQASLDTQLLVGIDYEADALWRLRLLVGGETRRFAAYRSHDALIAEAEVAWMPSGLTTIRGTLGRSVEDAAQEGVSGYTYTSGRLTIDHEYMRELVLSASAGLQHAAFLQGGSQTGYTIGLGATWMVNRLMRVSATYDLRGLSGGHAGTQATAGPSTHSLALLTVRFGL